MKFIVSASLSPCGEAGPMKQFTDIESAMHQWFKYQMKYPTCASIQPDTKASGVELLKWVNLNIDKVMVWCVDYKCPYNKEWLKKYVADQVKSGRCSMQWEYDMLYPFCEG